jgi:DNA-directed RNA polymerase subunit E'/Rpb7
MVENKDENLDTKVELEQQETVEAQAPTVGETVEATEPEAEVVEEAVEASEPVEAVVDEVVAEAEEPAVEETVAPAKTPKKAKAAKVVVAEPAEFDWDALEEEDKGFSGKTKKDLETLYEKTLTTVQEKEVVEGRVISMNKREVVVDIGYKSDGIVSLNEFRYNPELKPKDLVEVYIESLEDIKGQMILSHKKARAMRSWDRVNEALDKDEVIKGFIKCRTKGGMIVDVFGIEAFLPGSQIDVKPIRDYDMYVNKTMEFKVVKINHEFRNVVVSHKALIEAELELQKKEIISKLEKGQVLPAAHHRARRPPRPRQARCRRRDRPRPGGHPPAGRLGGRALRSLGAAVPAPGPTLGPGQDPDPDDPRRLPVLLRRARRLRGGDPRRRSGAKPAVPAEHLRRQRRPMGGVAAPRDPGLADLHGRAGHRRVGQRLRPQPGSHRAVPPRRTRRARRRRPPG